jgi:hypothetical protein
VRDWSGGAVGPVDGEPGSAGAPVAMVVNSVRVGADDTVVSARLGRRLTFAPRNFWSCSATTSGWSMTTRGWRRRRDEPFSSYAQGTLDTVDVQFRPGGATLFKPYVSLPFGHSALVEVVTGPAIRNELAESTVRRMLDRNGFRHAKIRASDLPYQT